MSASMKAAVLHGPLDLRLESRPVPTPAPDEVLVAVRAVGVCGSDVHYWRSGRIGDFVVRSPLVLGHECAGVVAEAGSAVRSLKPGDRVALEPGVPCRRCAWCKSGRYNLCPDVVFMATPPVDGAFAEYVAHPADFAYVLPEGVSLEEGALLEPLSVGLHAVRRSGLGPGGSVLVAGAGPIGLTALLAARAAGAAAVLVSDVVPNRLEMARKLGASAALDVRSVDLAAEVARLTDGLGVDVAIECSGAPAAQTAALASLKRGGVVVLVGMGTETMALPVADLQSRELDVRAVFRYANTYPAAVGLVASGQIDLEPLVTHHFTLDEVCQAMETAHGRTGGAIKVVVHPTRD